MYSNGSSAAVRIKVMRVPFSSVLFLRGSCYRQLVQVFLQYIVITVTYTVNDIPAIVE